MTVLNKNFWYLAGWVIGLVVVILGLIWPVPADWLEKYAQYLLMISVFLSVLDINFQRVVINLKNSWQKWLTGWFFYLLIPLLVWLFKDFWPEEVFQGLMLVAVMPAALNAGDMVEWTGGLSVKARIAVFLTNFISPVVVVWMCFWLMAGLDINQVFLSLLKLVMVPVLLASIVRKLIGRRESIIHGWWWRWLVWSGLVLIIVSGVSNNIIYNWDKSLLVALMALVVILIGIVVGYFMGNGRKEQVTMALAAGFKNTPLAVVLAVILFGQVSAVPVVVYLIVEIIIMGPLVWLGRKIINS